jgi:uncharacterized protein (DUF849 family)
MLLKAAINGGRTKAEHAAVPVSPEEQAADVLECLRAGAQAIHLHVRSATGRESLDGDDVARTLSTIRSACTRAGIDAGERRIGITTGLWILPDPEERLRTATSWEVLPDFVSVNFVEEGAIELARLLLSRGVDIEAGLSDPSAAAVFLQSELPADCIRVLIEPQEQDLDQAIENVNRIEKLLDESPCGLPRVLHGTDATTWPMLSEALTRGYFVRIGFEDTFVLPDGTSASTNAELVSAAVKRIAEFGLG